MKKLPFQQRILVVDDNPKNIQLVGSFLTQEGYTVEFASGGREALEWLETELFDLILMDVMMPGMDGFQVCAALKKIKGREEIPVIFLTAKHDLETFREGFRVGGVDYIFKPFVMEELIVRVRTHLQIASQQKQLKNLNATRDKLLSIISHDLRTPVFSNVLLLERIVGKTSRFSHAELEDLLLTTLESARGALGLLERLLIWAKAQTGQIVFEPIVLNPSELAAEVLESFQPLASAKKLKLKVTKSSTAKLRTDYFMLTTLLRNIISNAVNFSREKGVVELACAKEKDMVVITVTDAGIGMNKDQLQDLFNDALGQPRKSRTTDHGSGLGLLICKDFIDRMGGSLSIKSTPNKGTKVQMSLPVGIKA